MVDRIEPGRIAFEVFGPGPPKETAAEVNAWIQRHDLERYPITNHTSNLSVEPERGVVLTVIFTLTNPTDEERKAREQAEAQARSQIQRIDRIPFNGA